MASDNSALQEMYFDRLAEKVDNTEKIENRGTTYDLPGSTDLYSQRDLAR